MFYFCACSFGKDSLATVLLALHHNEPLDEVVFTEVMFDNKRGISGEEPEHISWVKTHAAPLLEAMGVKVRIIPTEVDYLDSFNHVIKKSRKHPERNGKKRAFPIADRCSILRDCKLRTMKKYIKSLGKDYTQYVGIAEDETERLLKKQFNDGHRVSLLKKYKYTEKMALDLCRRYNLLSPSYKTTKRNGCWFCPNRRIKDIAQFKLRHPELWNELLVLEQEPNKVSPCFCYNLTLTEINNKIDWINRQQRIIFN